METLNGKIVARVRLDKSWSDDGSTMTAAFVGYDDEGTRLGPVNGVEPVVFNRTEMSPDNIEAAFRHGIEQKIGDAAALSRDTKSGKSASLADKRAEMIAVAERIASPAGEWNAKGGRGPVSVESLIAKLAAMGYDVSKKNGPAVDVTPKE